MLNSHSLRWKFTFLLFLLLLSSLTFSLKIFGIVTDENNNPISNVNIYSGNAGTTSDDEGKFEIDVTENAIITFSHIGFEEIQFKGNELSESITMKKENLLGQNVFVNSSLDKRDLYNTPSSVTLFNSRKLSIKSDNHLEGLLDQISNLNYASGTSRPRYFQIRGIGERSHYAGEGPPNYSIGFLMDGIDFSGIGMVGHLFDVNQIEVFKGPQSTVFGPNAIAGSINITTYNPTSFYTGKFETIFSNDNGKTYSMAVGGPILKTLSFRLSGTNHSQNGFIKNVFMNKENTNGKDESFIRSKLLWQPMNDLSISYTNLKSDLNNKYDAWAPDNNEELITYTNQQGMDSQKSSANALKINLPEIMGITTEYKFSNSTNYLLHRYDGDWGNDSLWANEPYFYDSYYYGYFLPYDYFDEINRTKYIRTNEYTFYSGNNSFLPSNNKIIVGLYTSYINQKDIATGWLFDGDASDLHSDFTINTKAYYGNYNVKLTETSEFNLNSRYEQYSISYLFTGGNWGSPIPAIDTSKTDNFFGVNLSVKNQIYENVLLYSTFSKGYKPGGINQHPSLMGDSRFYDSEYIVNLEFGCRISWKKIKLNFAIFRMNRKNMQVQVSSQQVEDDPNSFTYFTSNAGKGSNDGFELETSVNLFSNLNLNYSFGYLNTYVEEFSYPVGLDSLGNEIYEITGDREQAMAPSFNSSLNIYYNHDFGLFVIGNFTTKDEYYFSDSHDQKSNPYSLVNLDVGYRKNNFTISVWGKNLTDERYAVRGFYFGLEPPYYEDTLYKSYGNPREIGLKLSYQF